MILVDSRVTLLCLSVLNLDVICITNIRKHRMNAAFMLWHMRQLLSTV